MGALSYSIGVEYKGGGEYQVDPNQYEGNGWQRKVYSWMVVMGDCYSSSSKWIDSECLNFMCYMAQGNIDTVIHIIFHTKFQMTFKVTVYHYRTLQNTQSFQVKSFFPFFYYFLHNKLQHTTWTILLTKLYLT